MADTPSSFPELSKMNYKAQSIWFLNGFWDAGMSGEANKVWDFCEYFVELDKQQTPPKGANGNELDQFWSAKFLEDKDAAMPALQRKEALKSIDVDSNGKMSCIEYLVWKYKKGVTETLNSPQGDNKEAIEEAQRKMEEVQSALNEVATRLESQQAALAENNAASEANQKATEENSRKMEEVAQAKAETEAAIEAVKEAQAAVLQAEEELKNASAELKAQEDSYNNKIAELEKKSQEGSMVQKSKAANELAQLKAEDPLPLRKAKITNDAALRKVAKQTKEAHEKIDAGEAKKKELEGIEAALSESQAELERTQAELERSKAELEEAVANLSQAQTELEGKMDEAFAELEEAKKASGVANGAIYWMQRELFEADKSLAKAKQKFDHSKPFEFTA